MLALLASVAPETVLKHVKCFSKVVFKEVTLRFDA